MIHNKGIKFMLIQTNNIYLRKETVLHKDMLNEAIACINLFLKLIKINFITKIKST